MKNYLLSQNDIHPQDILNYVIHGIPRVFNAKSTCEPGTRVCSPEVESALQEAYACAQRKRHEFLTLEHLLLALLDCPTASAALAAIGAHVLSLHEKLAELVDVTTPCFSANDDRQTEPTRAFNRVMQLAVAKSRSSAQPETDALHVLWALCREDNVPAADFLRRYNVTRGVLALYP